MAEAFLSGQEGHGECGDVDSQLDHLFSCGAQLQIAKAALDLEDERANERAL